MPDVLLRALRSPDHSCGTGMPYASHTCFPSGAVIPSPFSPHLIEHCLYRCAIASHLAAFHPYHDVNTCICRNMKSLQVWEYHGVPPEYTWASVKRTSTQGGSRTGAEGTSLVVAFVLGAWPEEWYGMGGIIAAGLESEPGS